MATDCSTSYASRESTSRNASDTDRRATKQPLDKASTRFNTGAFHGRKKVLGDGHSSHGCSMLFKCQLSSHLITSHHISSHLITSHHISSHLITSHHISLHLITSHHKLAVKTVRTCLPKLICAVLLSKRTNLDPPNLRLMGRRSRCPLCSS